MDNSEKQEDKEHGADENNKAGIGGKIDTEGRKIADESIVKDVAQADYSMSEKEEQYDIKKLSSFVFSVFGFVKKHWVVFALLIIFLLSFNLRLSGFVMPDGSYRWPYLRNIDSYALMHQMQMILDNGGVMPAFDPLLLAPEGVKIVPHLYPYQYAGAYGYLFVRMFIPDLQLWEFLIYFPAFLAALMVIPAYYIGKLLYDKKAGVLAAFLMVFAPAITMRSLAGDPDTDAVAMLLTLASMAVFLLAYKSVRKNVFTKRNIIYAILAGAVLSVYSYAWAGAWHIPLLITGFVAVKLVLDFVVSKGNVYTRISKVWTESKHLIYMFAIFFITFIILMAPFFGFNYVPDTVFGTPMGMLGLFGERSTFKSEEGRQFPNVYVSVAELQSGGDMASIANRTGSMFFILTFVFTLPYLILSYIVTKKHLDTAILIILWTVGALIASMAAIRFSTILSPPVIIGSAIIMAKLWRLALGQDKKILK